MSALVFFKLVAIFAVVAIGWVVGKLKWLVPAEAGTDPARTLAHAAYCIIVPALLFRTTAGIEFNTMPWGTLVAATARNTLIHPVVSPVLALAGLLFNALGLPLPPVADDILQTLGQAVVPLCLVLIGMSLAYYGVRGAARAAVGLSLLKLLVLPALVLAVARWGFHLQGLPLAALQ
jgi:predicted permease